MRKSDGSYTYFVPDVAYHLDKCERGFTRRSTSRAPTTTARSRACAPACRRPAPASRRGYPDYVLQQDGRGDGGGEEVKISKRAGGYVTLRDLIDWTSRDAVRFFLLSRKADTEFTFDVDLALKQNDENPVFYVQYAHARICSVLEQYAAQAATPATLPMPTSAALVAPSETALMLKLADYPQLLAARRRPGAARRRVLPARRWRPPSTATTAPSDSSSTIPAGARAAGVAGGDAPGAAQRARRVLGVGAPRANNRETETRMKASPTRVRPTRRLPHRHGRRPADRPGAGAGRRPVRDQGAGAFRQQGAGAHAEQDAAEAEKNRNWDPNSAWPAESGAGRRVRRPATAAPAPAASPRRRRSTRPPGVRLAAGRRGARHRRRRAACRAAPCLAGHAARRRRPSPTSCKPAPTPAAKRRSSSAPSWRCRASRASSPSASRAAGWSTASASARSNDAKTPRPPRKSSTTAGVDRRWSRVQK